MTENLLADKAKYELVWAAMRELGIDEIEVEFNGEGDSGEITDVSVPYRSDMAGEQHVELNARLERCAVTLIEGEPPVKLVDLITELSDPLTTEQDINWWDGDGGFGVVHWILANGEPPEPMIAMSIEERIVTTNSHMFEFDRHGEAQDDEMSAERT
jgi:hypothetical protein